MSASIPGFSFLSFHKYVVGQFAQGDAGCSVEARVGGRVSNEELVELRKLFMCFGTHDHVPVVRVGSFSLYDTGTDAMAGIGELRAEPAGNDQVAFDCGQASVSNFGRMDSIMMHLSWIGLDCGARITCGRDDYTFYAIWRSGAFPTGVSIEADGGEAYHRLRCLLPETTDEIAACKVRSREIRTLFGKARQGWPRIGNMPEQAPEDRKGWVGPGSRVVVPAKQF